jgi:hypothetical protein
VNPLSTSVFDLPDRLAAKADPALIAADEKHFAAIAESLEHSISELSDRLEATRRAPGGTGQAAMDRDMEVHRLTARLRTLRRFGLDLCLGRIVGADGAEPVYIGRLGLTDKEGRRLLVDWRSPVAEPFFGARHGNPMGLASRRRYRWTRGRISDYWDEVFTADEFEGHAAALDDQSAYIASLGSTRSPRMRDVLGTIQADQDAIIRAGSAGALVVDGGPGTGKSRHSSGPAPQPQSSPKVIVPSASSATRSPLLPSNRYSTGPFFNPSSCLRLPTWPRPVTAPRPAHPRRASFPAGRLTRRRARNAASRACRSRAASARRP